MAADESLHVSELKRLISEAKERELALHKERERLAVIQYEKNKKNYDDEMKKIRDSIAEAQQLALIHIHELKAEAEELMKQANATAAWQIKKDQEDIEEKRLLEEKEYNITKAEDVAKAKLIAAQKQEELAKTKQEVFDAQTEA